MDVFSSGRPMARRWLTGALVALLLCGQSGCWGRRPETAARKPRPKPRPPARPVQDETLPLEPLAAPELEPLSSPGDVDVGLAAPPTQPPLPLALVIPLTGDQRAERIAAGAAAFAQGLGIDLSLHAAATADDELTPQQVATLEDDVVLQQAERAAAVAVLPLEIADQQGPLTEAARRTKLVLLDQDAPETGRVAFLARSPEDEYQSGWAAAELVRQAFPDGCAIVLLSGNLQEGTTLAVRRQGLIDALLGRDESPARFDAPAQQLGNERYQFIDVLDERLDGDRPEESLENILTQSAITELICVVGLRDSDLARLAELGRLRDPQVTGGAHSLSGKWIGIGGGLASLELVASGRAFGAIVSDDEALGARLVRVMAALALNDQRSVAAELATRQTPLSANPSTAAALLADARRRRAEAQIVLAPRPNLEAPPALIPPSSPYERLLNDPAALAGFELGFHWGIVADAHLDGQAGLESRAREQAEVFARRLQFPLPQLAPLDAQGLGVAKLFADETELVEALRTQHGDSTARMFHLGFTMQITRGLYSPDRREFSETAARDLTRMALDVGLPEELLGPLLHKLRLRAAGAEVDRAVFAFERKLQERLAPPPASARAVP